MPKILICGYGSIGKKHALNLQKIGAEIKVWRTQQDQSATVQEDGFVFEPDLNAGIVWCEGLVIATATDQHLTLAQKAAEAKKHYYIEKPVGLSKEGLADLLKASEGLVVEVGCQMRQHPNLKNLKQRLERKEDGKVLGFLAWVGQRLDQWRPGTDYRKSYSVDSKRGGGALFDLVHEIDLMAWLAGEMSTVYADLRQNSDLEINAEDLANLILTAKNGAAGTVQLDMLSPAYRRGLQIICEKAVYTWNMKEGVLWRSENNGAPEGVHKIEAGYETTQMLHDAMAHFISRIANSQITPACSLSEGIHDLNILLAARNSNQTKKQESIEAL